MSVSSLGGTYGLSGSGMDIDAIVKKLMTGQQAKEDTLIQKKTVLEWQKTAYNTTYDDVNAFRSMTFNYKLQGTLSPHKVSSNNTAVATATANAEAADVNHSLVVAQLASGVNLTSTASITTPSTAAKDTIATQIYNGLAPAGSFKVDIANGTAKATITVNTGASINDLVSQINSAGINVKASYDSTLDRFFISTTNTGSAAGIKITDSADNASGDTSGTDFFANKLHIPIDSTGQNAEFKLDGVALSQASNTFTISGVTYNLTGESANIGTGDIASKLAAGQATSVGVTFDVDKAVASVQSFVDSYNKILAGINGKVNETRYTDFPPLTDAQKTSMKDSDITAWNIKAQSGMLHSDPMLTSLTYTMRNAISNPIVGVTGKYNSASSIGITTGDYSEGGKLYLDTDKLRTALNENPNVLTQLFGASGETREGNTTTFDTSKQGIAGRLYDGLKNTMDQLVQKAGTTMNAQYDTNSDYAKRISSYAKQINNAADRFDTIQAAYYKQYNAMEVALNQLSSQSSWLSSMVSSSSSS